MPRHPDNGTAIKCDSPFISEQILAITRWLWPKTAMTQRARSERRTS